MNCYNGDFLRKKYDVWDFRGFWKPVDPGSAVEELRRMFDECRFMGGREAVFLENVCGVLNALWREGVALRMAVIYGSRCSLGLREVFIPFGVDFLGELGGVGFAAQVFTSSRGATIWVEVPASCVSREVEERAVKGGFALEDCGETVRLLMFPRKKYGRAVKRLKRFLEENIKCALKV